MQKRKLVLSGLIVAGIGAAGGAIHPFGNLKTDPVRPVLAGAQTDPSVLRIIERSCQNCHSDRTDWPWYSRVAPGSWLLERDVGQARSRFNLSRWNEYEPDQRAAILSGIAVAARVGTMPPSRYTLLHPNARLSDEDKRQIYDWARKERRSGSVPH